ncbi:hypothetical protein HZS_4090 [Henneguya salminicola]|nr:hypothetical protein HZS_4090 [Henneguya salminicola]
MPLLNLAIEQNTCPGKTSWFDCAEKFLIFPDSDLIPLSDIDIAKSIKKKLKHKGIESLFPLQYKIYDYIQNDSQDKYFKRARDICICSPTGSGKTFCYVLPILQSYLKSRATTSIIIAPSIVLCQQIVSVLNIFSRKFDVDIRMSGNHDTTKDHIIWVLTPLRLKELLYKQQINHMNLKFIIFDEADKLFDQKHGDWQKILCEFLENNFKISTIENWLKCIKPIPQKIFLSATLKDTPEFISEMNLFQPVIFLTDKNDNSKPVINSNLKESFLTCDPIYKSLILAHIVLKYMKEHSKLSILCFVNNVNVLKRLSRLLTQHPDIKVSRHCSEMNQNKKNHNLNRFTNGKTNIMITTDSLSRGLDFPNVGLVINYENPLLIDSYLHRVGRTCRGIKKGYAITLISSDQYEGFLKCVTKASRSKPLEESKMDFTDLNYLKEWYNQSLANLDQ